MQHDLDRRRFLGAAIGTGAAAAAAGVWAPAAGAVDDRYPRPERDRRGRVPDDRIGIQLYTLRRLMPAGDRRAVRSMLRWLGEVGFAEVETAGYYGFEPRRLRRWLDDAGLRAVSGHDPLDIDPANTSWQEAYAQSLENANLLGQTYTGFAYFGAPYTEERFKFLAERFNQAGALARAAGLQFFHHNHDFEFTNKQADGTPLYDILLEETDPDLVKFELDIYWIITGGENPLAYLSADPARYPLYHVKDRTWKDRPGEQDFEDVGPGAIDFPDVFAAGSAPRLDKHYFVEHDWPQLSHPGDAEAEYKTALAGLEYLREVRW